MTELRVALRCDKCYYHLTLPDDFYIKDWRGMMVHEHSEELVLQSAKKFGWDIRDDGTHICPKCK